MHVWNVLHCTQLAENTGRKKSPVYFWVLTLTKKFLWHCCCFWVLIEISHLQQRANSMTAFIDLIHLIISRACWPNGQRFNKTCKPQSAGIMMSASASIHDAETITSPPPSSQLFSRWTWVGWFHLGPLLDYGGALICSSPRTRPWLRSVAQP